MDVNLEQAQSREASKVPFSIECSPAVLDQINADVAEAFYSIPHGGAETGGVLYGTQEESKVTIRAARPLSCEHAYGPAFNLSPNDFARLEALLEAPKNERTLAGLTVVGWYHSHTRSEISLTPADIEIHKKYFPGAWKVAVVLRPAPMQPTRAVFFFTETDGAIRKSSRQLELSVPRGAREPRAAAAGSPSRPAARRERAPEPERPQADEPDPGTRAALAPLPPPRPDVAPLSMFGSAPRREKKRARRPWWFWALGAAVLLTLIGAPLYLTREYWMPAASPAAALELRGISREGQLEIHWNSSAPQVRNARSGSLEITDGAVRRVIALDPAFLRAGVVSYTRRGEVVKLHFTVVTVDGTRLEQYSAFIGEPVAGGSASGNELPGSGTEQSQAQPGNPAASAQAVPPSQLVPAPPAAKQAAVPPTAAPTKQTAPPATAVLPPKQSAALTAALKPTAPAKPTPAGRGLLSPAKPQPTPGATPVQPRTQPELRPFTPPPSTAQQPAQIVQSKPPEVPAPAVTAQKAPPPVVVQSAPAPQPPAPKPVAPAASTPLAPAASTAPAPVVKPPSLSGQWIFSPASPSGSPFKPEAVTLTITDDGETIQGSLTGRYKTSKASGLKPDVRLTFRGPVRPGSMHFGWGAADGTVGSIDLVRLPNNINSLEVVWYNQGRQYIFDDVLVKKK